MNQFFLLKISKQLQSIFHYNLNPFTLLKSINQSRFDYNESHGKSDTEIELTQSYVILLETQGTSKLIYNITDIVDKEL